MSNIIVFVAANLDNFTLKAIAVSAEQRLSTNSRIGCRKNHPLFICIRFSRSEFLKKKGYPKKTCIVCYNNDSLRRI